MKVIINYQDNICFSAKTRNFNDIIIDEPESFYGTNRGPSSLEYVLIGIGGCLASTLTFCFMKKEMSLQDLRLEVEGKLKHVEPTERLELVKVDVKFQYCIDDRFPKEEIEYCINNFEKYCVVSNSLMHGIPVSTHFKRVDGLIKEKK